MVVDPADLARRLAAAQSGEAVGDPQALLLEAERLISAHKDLVYATCLRFVSPHERAVEVAQDALLKAYLKLPTFQGNSKFTTWLVGIARYEALNALRKGRDALTSDGVIDDTDPAQSALASLRRHEREELLRRAAAEVLDATEQEVVYLRYVENLPLPQIEAALGLDGKSGARGVLQRCKRKLGRAIRAQLEAQGLNTSFLRESVDR